MKSILACLAILFCADLIRAEKLQVFIGTGSQEAEG